MPLHKGLFQAQFTRHTHGARSRPVPRWQNVGERMAETGKPARPTGAEDLLRGLRRAGVRYFFANSGTDFPPIIEAMARLDPGERPEPVLVPHESAGVAMVHGHYLATGAPQAVMVHVNVGLANAAMGVINAACDDIPLVMMSGRTPITEAGRPGSRVSPIQYGQEMFDQSSLVADVVKYHYEMRYPEQGAMLATRAVTLAASAPQGPVYLSLPREPLMEAVPEGLAEPNPQVVAQPAAPDPQAIARLATWISAAEAPLILCQRGDPAGRLGHALAALAERHAIAVVEPFVVRNLLAWDHPMLQGNDPGPALAAADLVVVLDSPIPWIESRHRPGEDLRVAHVAPDPLFRRMPVRGHRADLAIASDPLAAIEALAAALPAPDARVAARRERLAAAAAERRARLQALAEEGCAAPMSTEWMSHCIGEALADEPDALIFAELGALPQHMRPAGPNRLFWHAPSGGLGWALPAALGAQMADRERLVVASMGDGCHIFSNPVACHQIAEALDLPVLTIIKNNGMWNAVRRSVADTYPHGAAVRGNDMPLVSLAPEPDYTMIARASRAHAERVTDGAALPDALARAIRIIREERRQVLLDVRVAVSDRN